MNGIFLIEEYHKKLKRQSIVLFAGIEKTANHLNKISYTTIIMQELQKAKNCVHH
jgi:hypothetical protein